MAIEDDIRDLLRGPLALSELARRALGEPPEEQSGNAEREARHAFEGTAVSALADALEARHRAEETRERLESTLKDRAEDGFREGDHSIAYDYAAFGMHTVKTFLELNARANRKVIEALRRSAEVRGQREDRREPREQPLAPIRLELAAQPLAEKPDGDYGKLAHRVGEFELVNRRGGRLGVEFLDQPMTLTRVDDATQTLPVPLKFLPRYVDLEPGASARIFVELPAEESNKIARDPGDVWHGTVPTRITHGRHAPLTVLFLARTPRPPLSAGGGLSGTLTLYTLDRQEVRVFDVTDGVVEAGVFGERGTFVARLQPSAGGEPIFMLVSLTGEPPLSDEQDVRQVSGDE